MGEPNYGPAGIFSTDDPGADMRQIEAEQGPWEEWEEEGLLAEMELLQSKLYGCCPECLWWDSALYRADDPVDLEREKDRLRDEHEAECPDCAGELEFDLED